MQEERMIDGGLVVDHAPTVHGTSQVPLALLRVLADLGTEHDPDALAHALVRRLVAEVPELHGAAAWLWSPTAERFQLAAIATVDGLTVFDPAHASVWTLRLHEGHVGKAVAGKQPIVFSDATALMHSLWDIDTPHIATLREDVSRIPATLRVMSVPLLHNDAPVGALDLYSSGDGAPFDLADVSVLQSFAGHMAGLFTSARRYADLEAQYQGLQAFDAVVTAINDADEIGETLQHALDATLGLVNSRHGMIALVNNGLAHLEASHRLSFDQAGLPTTWDVATAPFAEVVETGEPAVQTLADDHAWAALRAQGITALAFMPLWAGGTVVGVLGIGGDDTLAATIDWPVLLPIAAQIGIAAAHYQLYTLGQRERRRLAGVIASIAEGVLIFDRVGTVVLANHAATVSLGDQPLEPGTTLAQLNDLFNVRSLDGHPMPPEDMPITRALNGVVGHDEVLIRSGGDDVILSLSSAPLLAEDGSIDGAVVTFRDVTAQKRRAAVRDEFLAVAAHELRAPLAAIKGYSDLLVKREIQRPDATERDRKGIMMLSAQIDHLVRLVDNLLDVSRIDTGRLDLYLQAMDLIALIEVCMDRVSVSNINHNIVFNGPPTLEILGDQLRLQQVFTNLLANAVRYSAPGTDVFVDVWTETIASEAPPAQDGSETVVVVAVRDQGVGIPPEAQSQVFERYFRANTSLAASGLGLGLYLCREIVTRHGGHISLESTPNQGTTFYVTLPQNLQRRAQPALLD